MCGMVNLNQSRTQTLLTYKYFIRPTTQKLYGDRNSKKKHHQNIQRILKSLAIHGPLTTWEMAKIKFVNDYDKIRTKEKEYRRLIVGRKDRGVSSEGLVDLNLILVDSISNKRNPGNIYRLSIFGILYCLDKIEFTNNEIDKIAKNYQIVLPLVFGKWDFLKSIIGNNVHNLSLLGKGLLFDNPNILKIENKEFYELISYFNIKTNLLSQSLIEKELGELVSLWFYVTLLYFPNLIKKTKINYLKKVLSKDPDIKDWFLDFVSEAQMFYKNRTQVLRNISIV